MAEGRGQVESAGSAGVSCHSQNTYCVPGFVYRLPTTLENHSCLIHKKTRFSCILVFLLGMCVCVDTGMCVQVCVCAPCISVHAHARERYWVFGSLSPHFIPLRQGLSH